jgi:hypothetical protein
MLTLASKSPANFKSLENSRNTKSGKLAAQTQRDFIKIDEVPRFKGAPKLNFA